LHIPAFSCCRHEYCHLNKIYDFFKIYSTSIIYLSTAMETIKHQLLWENRREYFKGEVTHKLSLHTFFFPLYYPNFNILFTIMFGLLTQKKLMIIAIIVFLIIVTGLTVCLVMIKKTPDKPASNVIGMFSSASKILHKLLSFKRLLSWCFLYRSNN
jgi:hypothetical protein